MSRSLACGQSHGESARAITHKLADGSSGAFVSLGQPYVRAADHETATVAAAVEFDVPAGRIIVQALTLG
jgi:subtilisin family serine protease